MLELSDSTFQEYILNAKLPVLVDFWAPWCGPCKILGTILKKLDTLQDLQAKICKVNVDENPELSTRFHIRSIPAVLIFKNSELVDEIIGLKPEATYIQALED